MAYASPRSRAFPLWYTLRVAGVDALILLTPIGGRWLPVGFGLLRGFPRAAGS